MAVKNRLGPFVALASLIPVLVIPAQASPTPASHDWSDVSSLQPGRHVVVKLHKGWGRRVEGTFVASDSLGVTVRGKGETVTVPRYRIRKLEAKGSWYDFWIGTGTFLFLGAALDANPPVYQAPKAPTRGSLPDETDRSLRYFKLSLTANPENEYAKNKLSELGVESVATPAPEIR